jgi:PadR family transcriptional regulator, regulatory protein PadR
MIYVGSRYTYVDFSGAPMDENIRLSGPTLKVLRYLILYGREGRCGADVTRATNIGSSTVYPLLSRLKAAGWIIDQWEKVDPKVVKRPKRRLYRLTGEAQLKARALFRALSLGT